MNYGIFGVMMPLLMEKPTMEYLEDAGISVSAREIKREFKEIIKRQPDIGGYRNNLLMGLYLAAYLAAVYKARSDTVTEEVFAGLVEAICYSDIMRKMNQGKNFFTEKNMNTRNRLAGDAWFNRFPDNWKYTFSYNMGIPECRITYTKCAICEMAKRENCFHLVRYMCTTDYASQELMGNTLIRTKTLGNGDECCDFHIIGRKSKEENTDKTVDSRLYL